MTLDFGDEPAAYILWDSGVLEAFDSDEDVADSLEEVETHGGSGVVHDLKSALLSLGDRLGIKIAPGRSDRKVPAQVQGVVSMCVSTGEWPADVKGGSQEWVAEFAGSSVYMWLHRGKFFTVSGKDAHEIDISDISGYLRDYSIAATRPASVYRAEMRLNMGDVEIYYDGYFWEKSAAEEYIKESARKAWARVSPHDPAFPRDDKSFEVFWRAAGDAFLKHHGASISRQLRTITPL